MTKNGEDEIKIVDRRRFDDDGEEREDAPEKEEAPPPAEPAAQAPGQEAMPPVDFITFILSLSQTAFLSLGLGPELEGGKSFPVDLQSARWTIEALEMIQDKTKGNLTGEEERIFERLLAELRMAYVQVSGQHGGVTPS